MIKFFRKIRHNLLTEGNTVKYLKYALGEILLVVIGILIALSINNWNELRKTHNQDNEFLRNLKVELTVDISSLSSRKTQYQAINYNIANTIKLFDRGDENLTSAEQQVIVSALSQFQMFSPIDKNINRNDLIIAQGTIDRIDKELNQEFLKYLQETLEINAAITKLGETLQQLEILKIHPNVDYNYIDPNTNKLDFNFKEIANKRDVRNALQKSFGYHKEYITIMAEKIDEAEKLITLINKNLNRSD
ncbi:DUF6090 family protein [Algoriphagus sp. SE2]|uniref:DUF6090 family protein n=1 Tax=Algoriphagus sp. SE2 TaxID=3141536 RepID=UPI0031CD9950